MTNQVRIGIVGYGVVGQATHKFLNEQGCRVDCIVDPKFNAQREADLKNCDYIFVCIPTPFTESFNDSGIYKSLLFLQNYNGVVVFKSTIPLSFYNKIRTLFNCNKIIYMPEFLNENTAFDDVSQRPIILGGDYCLTHNLSIDLNLKNDECYFCTIKDAVNFKYIRNIYGAYKVLFWNFVQETTGNARKMKNMLDLVPQGEMAQVGMDGELGYGGKCFPKDVKQFLNEHPHELLKFMRKYNSRLRGYNCVNNFRDFV